MPTVSFLIRPFLFSAHQNAYASHIIQLGITRFRITASWSERKRVLSTVIKFLLQTDLI